MKKNKRLILHIGTTKTGSTSIQQSLGRSRDALLDHNIYYPRIKPYNHVITFPPIFMEDPERFFTFRQRLLPSEDKYSKVHFYREAWQKEFQECTQDNFIICAEILSIPIFSDIAVRRLKEFVEPYFEEVTVTVYVRHYDSWIPSQIQQEIKMGNLNKDLEETVKQFGDYPLFMSYRQSLEKWIKVFGWEKIVVRPFDPQVFYKGSLLADFFRACGLSADDISIPEVRSNESLGKHAVSFIHVYNQTYPVFKNGSINLERGLVRQRIPVELYNDLPDEKFKFEMVYSEEQAQKLNQDIDYVNQFFENGYQFSHVLPGKEKMQFSSADDIPMGFFVELINNFYRSIEKQQVLIKTQRERSKSLQEQYKNLQKQNNDLLEQNAYFQKIINVLKIPLFLRAINKLPFVKKVFQRITGW